MKNLNKILLLLIIVSFFMIGCVATPPKLLNMVPKNEKLVFKSTGKSLKIVSVIGGEETNPLLMSKINAPGFRNALIKALNQSNLFSRLLSKGNADYELSAKILAQDQPGFGMDMSVNLAVAYVIKNSTTGEKLYDEIVTSSYTAGVGEAFIGSTRVRKANEGAVRENIKHFLLAISKLQF